MSFTRLNSFSKKPSDLPDVPSPSMTPDDIRSMWETPLDELLTNVQSTVDTLNKTTSGTSGADNVGATGWSGVANTVQALLNWLKANKTDLTGDHKGTWQGFKPTQTDPGIQGQVDSNTSQLSDISSDDTFKNNHFLSTLPSYVGLKNTGYTSDNGTRFYILPKDVVTTGVGGAIKIFGDAYQNDNQNYRDCGVYFSADQNGDTGQNGKGVFWLNSKVFGSYLGYNHDIGFSFQDGQWVGGRFTLATINGQSYPCFIVGSSHAQVLPEQTNTRLELQGWMGLRNADRIGWLNSSGNGLHYIWADNTDYMKIMSTNGLTVYTSGGVQKFQVTSTSTTLNNALVRAPLQTLSDAGTNTAPQVAGYNRLKFAQTAACSITNFTGAADGQCLTCLFTNTNTTIKNNSTIILKGGVDYTPTGANEVLKLENFGGVWYEVSRSINHA